MLSTRWEPWTELNRLSRDIDRLFGSRGGGLGRLSDGGAYPAMSVWHDNENLYAETELPGFDLKDLEIYVVGNQLTIKGERKLTEHEGGQWHRQERGFGKFHRTIELPGEIDGSRVSAEFKHGVLLVTLPKNESVKPRRIEVVSQ